MRVTTIKKSCPHCGKEYDSYVNSIFIDQKWGSPIRTCQTCKKHFIDEAYTEPACADKWFSKPYWWKPRTFQKNMMANLGAAVLFFDILMWACGTFSVDGIYAFAAVVAGCYLLPMPINLLSHKKRLQAWEIEYRESKERVSNQNYVNLLYTLSKHKIRLNNDARDIGVQG